MCRAARLPLTLCAPQTGRWYVRTGPDRRPVAYRKNPVILDVGLAISISVAVIANLAIVGRFLERLSPGR